MPDKENSEVEKNEKHFVNIYKMSDAQLLEGLPPEVQESIMQKVEAQYQAFEAGYEEMKVGLEGLDLHTLEKEIKSTLPRFRKEAIEREKIAYLKNEKPPTKDEVWRWLNAPRGQVYDVYISPKD